MEDDHTIEPTFIARGVQLLDIHRRSILTFNQRLIDYRHDPLGRPMSQLRDQEGDHIWSPDQLRLLAFLGQGLPNGGYFWRIDDSHVDLTVGQEIQNAQLQEFLRQLRVNQPILVCHESLSNWSLLPDDDLRRPVGSNRAYAADLNQLSRAVLAQQGLARLRHLARNTTQPNEVQSRFNSKLIELSLLSPACFGSLWSGPDAAIRTLLRVLIYGRHSCSTLNNLAFRKPGLAPRLS